MFDLKKTKKQKRIKIIITPRTIVRLLMTLLFVTPWMDLISQKDFSRYLELVSKIIAMVHFTFSSILSSQNTVKR